MIETVRKWVKEPAFPYVAPFVAFMVIYLGGQELLGFIATLMGGEEILGKFITHPISVFVVGGLLWFNRKRFIKIELKRPLASFAMGVLGTVLWVYFYSTPEDPSDGFNPFPHVAMPVALALIIFRIIGFSLVTPFMEEIFWRGFLMRILLKEDDKKLDNWQDPKLLGKYGHFSFWATTVLFVFAHSTEPVVAIIFALLAGGWFLYTKTLGDVILLHAVTNLTLAAYVLLTQNWYFW
jgi:CAAX prenyl protease-like protein